jgi:hypothetical protein
VLIFVADLDILIFFVYRKKIKFPIKKLAVDWALIAVILLAILYLSNVHYNYTGKYTVEGQNQFQYGEHISYQYPYFSDEWDAIALIKNTIEKETLATQMPYLENGSQFINYETAFHSLLSELFVLMGLEPSTNYINISIAFNVLLILLIYILLRSQSLSTFSAATGALLALYITNGANLPGLWTLIPLTLGILTFLLGLIFFSYNYRPGIFLLYFLSIVFYPPMAIFYILALFFYSIKASYYTKQQKIELLMNAFFLIIPAAYIFMKLNVLHFFSEPLVYISFILDIVIVLAVLALEIFPQALQRVKRYVVDFIIIIFSTKLIFIIPSWAEQRDHFLSIWNIIFYDSYTGNFIPQYSVFAIIPIITLIFAVIGSKIAFKKISWIIVPTIVGFIIWGYYSTSVQRLVIDYQRVIVVTAILTTIISGFGIHYFYEFIKKYLPFDSKKARRTLVTTSLVIFFFGSFYYTEQSNWERLIAINKISGDSAIPGAPANKYLNDEDIEIFSKIHNKRFLSSPWKGKVLGVVTDNYPLAIKSGTISLNTSLPHEFIAGDCSKKAYLSKLTGVDYVYFPEFNCPDFFKPVSGSAEGFVLYKVNK